ncbi:MAG: SGNH/GDSL hydrolase family protein [Bacteroidota bacterium]
MSEDQSITFLALGDSYTIGERVRVDQRWPVQLAERLRGQGVEMEDPRIVAVTGWTTDELASGIEKAQLAERYDWVSLLIGVNNQYRGYEFSQYEQEFEELLQQAIAFASGDTSRVFVVSIPDYGVTPFAEERDPEKIGKEIDQYNAYAKELATSRGVKYFDITPISREAKDDLELVADDQLHPSGKMYTRWVDMIFPWVYDIMNDGKR